MKRAKKLKTGNVVRHKATGSRWIIVDIRNPADLKQSNAPPTISVSGYCLFTGERSKDYWKVGQIDTWLVDTDKNGNAHHFYKMWDVEL